MRILLSSLSRKFVLYHMRRYFLDIAYNGAQYCGWQKQPDCLSVQEVIEKTLSTLYQQPIDVVGAGRTDAGVHAKQLIVHVDLAYLHTDDMVFKLNAMLPKDISVQNIVEVIPTAHARFHATARAYEYHIAPAKNVFLQGLAYQIRKMPDIALMNEAASILLSHTNFKCFSRSKTDVKTYNCDIRKAYWKAENDMLIFTIEADRFLRNMVRAIVGTLLDIGYQVKSIEQLHEILNSKDRTQAGASAPAHGLYLTKVAYPASIYK